MFINFIEFFLKGLAFFGTVIILLWIVRWESISYVASTRGEKNRYPSVFYIIKLFSRNHFFHQKNIKQLYTLAFFSLGGGFLQFTMFPLCGTFFFQGREIFSEYCRTEIGLALVLVGIVVNHIAVGMARNYRSHHGRNMHIVSRLACFISSTGILLITLLSLFVTYESLDFHEIVRRQNSFFEYGLFLQPVAAIVFFGCIQIEGCTELFPVTDKNYYNEIDGFEIFFLKFLEKTRWLCLITVYVFVFLGGYSLLPGLDHVIKIFPKILQISQFVSLIFKISLVAFIAIVVRYSFLEYREIDITRLAFKKLIPIAFINFIIMASMKIY